VRGELVDLRAAVADRQQDRLMSAVELDAISLTLAACVT